MPDMYSPDTNQLTTEIEVVLAVKVSILTNFIAYHPVIYHFIYIFILIGP